jgi:hypothetical protein
LLRLCSRTGFPLTLHSDRFPPDRMNGFGLRRSRAPSIANGVFRRTGRPINDFCNRREGRAHPGAARHPARRRVERRRVAIEGLRAAEHRLPGWESSSRSTGHLDSTKLRHEAREACSNLSGHPCRAADQAENPERAPVCSVPQGPPSTYRANGKVVERTRVPSRRSEPRLFTVAPRKAPAEPNEGVHFSRERRYTLDGAHRRTRGREAVPMAQNAI